jgi:hypothetical protein
MTTIDPILLLAEKYIESELSKLGRVRAFHPTKEAIERRRGELVEEVGIIMGRELISNL